MDLEKHRIDALFVSNYYNICYLTGFSPLSATEREGWALVTKKNIYLFTDGRYFHEFSVKNKRDIKPRLISTQHTLTHQLQEIIATEKIQTIGFESEDLTYAEYKLLKKRINIKFKPTSNLILKKREYKLTHELSCIKKASHYTDLCLEHIIKSIKIGETEQAIAYSIESFLKQNNCENAFDPIVAIDKNSSNIHYTPSGAKVKNNSIILIDMGAKYNKYCTDITRMVFIGKPSSEYVNIYHHLLHTQTETIKNIAKNKKYKDLDMNCRTMIKTYGLPEFAHSLGHGVGLEVHELPHVSYRSKDYVTPGQVITVEPGVYFDNRFGMRIEDTVYIDENKKPLVLTKFSKEMRVIKG
jgi:Xaa-Pro aminopeptidase